MIEAREIASLDLNPFDLPIIRQPVFTKPDPVDQIIKPVRDPLLNAAILANTDLVAQGITEVSKLNIINMSFWDTYMSLGGSGCTIGLHTHETSSEIIYILSGAGKVKYDDGEEAVSAGQCHYCPKGHSHALINNSGEPLEFFAVVPNQ